MQDLNYYMQQTFLENTLWQYSSMLLIIIDGVIFKRFVSRFTNRLLFRLFRKFTQDITADRFHDMMHKPVDLTIMVLNLPIPRPVFILKKI